MDTPRPTDKVTLGKAGMASRLGGMRRRLLLLAGLGAAIAVKAATDNPTPAQAAQVQAVGTGFAGLLDSQADGVQGYAAGVDNAGSFGRNNDLNRVGTYRVVPNGTGVFGFSSGRASHVTGSAIMVDGGSFSAI